MRRSTVLLAVLGAWLGGVGAMSCSPNGCVYAECDPFVSEQSCRDGEFRHRGSICSCCNVCIPYADEYDLCPPNFLPGYPPDVVCRPPLECVNDVCVHPDKR